jgi:hypothetical protein
MWRWRRQPPPRSILSINDWAYFERWDRSTRKSTHVLLPIATAKRPWPLYPPTSDSETVGCEWDQTRFFVHGQTPLSLTREPCAYAAMSAFSVEIRSKADIGLCEHPTYSFARRPAYTANGAPGLSVRGSVRFRNGTSEVSKNVPKV